MCFSSSCFRGDELPLFFSDSKKIFREEDFNRPSSARIIPLSQSFLDQGRLY
ncbi:hypothetical protein CHCC20335_3578 [Bacillus paralicheniformis]|nr:hypothetical protein CHCC20335_3578 [Bacillus paralicheniformis]